MYKNYNEITHFEMCKSYLAKILGNYTIKLDEKVGNYQILI